MKKSAYVPLDPVKGIISLLLKLISQKQGTLLLVSNQEKAEELSELLWRSYYFMPHGLDTEEFAQLQPVLISSQLYPRPITILFDLDEPPNFNGDSLILWNRRPKGKDFVTYEQQPDLTWKKA